MNLRIPYGANNTTRMSNAFDAFSLETSASIRLAAVAKSTALLFVGIRNGAGEDQPRYTEVHGGMRTCRPGTRPTAHPPPCRCVWRICRRLYKLDTFLKGTAPVCTARWSRQRVFNESLVTHCSSFFARVCVSQMSEYGQVGSQSAFLRAIIT